MANYLPSPDTMDRLAWTLAHFLWQGSLLALLAAGILRSLRRYSAEARYSVSVAALLFMLATPLATFFWDVPEITGSSSTRIAQMSETPVPSSLPLTPSEAPNAWTGWVVAAWFTGVAACSIRLAAGWHVTRRLLQSSTAPASHYVAEIFEHMLGRLDLARPVRLLVSARIDSPVAVGWLRPAVLLPVKALTGLDESQLRAVLAHELAHIRRHDFAVNLLQRCVESLLFYHPAVWWLSARIRAEREHCCDDLAVHVCGDPLTYARALVELERSRGQASAFAMAATGGDLARRVRRILGREAAGGEWVEWIALPALVATVLLAGAFDWNSLWAQEPPPAPPVPPVAAAAPPPAPFPPPAPVALAAAMPAPPAPPAPPAQASTRSFRVSRFDDDSWVLFRGGTVMMSGSSGDEAEARITRRSIGGDLLWMRVDGRTYVVTDKATLDRIAALYAPMEKLGEQQRELGQQQRALGDEQRKLGQQQRQVRVPLPDLQADLERIKADLRADATQEELSRLQSRIGELQSRIGRLQSQAGGEQSKLGHQQAELGRKQSELGRQQAELGRQQSEIAERADKQVRELLRDAVKTRLAKPIV